MMRLLSTVFFAFTDSFFQRAVAGIYAPIQHGAIFQYPCKSAGFVDAQRGNIVLFYMGIKRAGGLELTAYCAEKLFGKSPVSLLRVGFQRGNQ